MASKIRASGVKTALYEITKELVAKRTYSPTKAIAELRIRHGAKILADATDIEDYGLRAIAGLVRAKPAVNDDQGVLWKIKEFETYVYELPDGQTEKRVVNVLDCTLQDYDARITRNKKTNPDRKLDMTSEDYFLEMRNKGIVGLTLREYLRSR